jgi:hypothetical protein
LIGTSRSITLRRLIASRGPEDEDNEPTAASDRQVAPPPLTWIIWPLM